MAWKSYATPIAPDPTTYGYAWNSQLVTRVKSPAGDLVMLPEYYRLKKDGPKTEWIAETPVNIPEETGLKDTRFDRPHEEAQKAYDTPESKESTWKNPGPSAGPFEVRLGDGSVVTYYWYRFADQPALLNADLAKEEREKMQGRVERLHRAWTKDRNYLAPPTVGRLAELDPAQIVEPPKGMEVGYVPIATRQEIAKKPGDGK